MKKLYLVTLLACTVFSFQAKSQITSIIPNQGLRGQQVLSAIVTSNGLFVQMASPSGNLNNIHLRQGATWIQIFDIFNWNPNVMITHPDTVTGLDFSIPSNTPLGLYDLIVMTQDQFGNIVTNDTLHSAFTVLSPVSVNEIAKDKGQSF